MTDVDLSRLRGAGAKFQSARADLNEARDELQPLILEALRADVAQRVIVDLTGYTREMVRQIARANGIEPSSRQSR